MDLKQARAILDVAHSAFVSMDEEGTIVYWNRQAEEVFGWSRSEAVGMALADTIIPERYREEHRQGVRNFLRNGDGPKLNRRVELAALRADGNEFPIELTISALGGPGEWSFHAFIADISQRKAAERERQRLLEELRQALHGSEQRLAVTMNALAEAVTIRGRDNHVVYANAAALERLGIASVQELREADPERLLGPYEIFDEQGGKVRLEDLPSVRLLRGESRPEPMLLRYLDRGSGAESWALLKATAVHDAQGEIEAAVTVIEDVTATRRAVTRLELLARAGEILASSLDYEQTLRNVASLAVPEIADWCGVDLFDEQGLRENVAVAHVDPEKVRLAERLRTMEPQELDQERGLGLVLRTGRPALYPVVTGEMLAAAARSAEHLELLWAVGLRSVVIVPMIARGRTIGALTLVSSESGRAFGQGDIDFAEQLAAKAALAVDNARLFSERSQVAKTLQDSLLPDVLPDVPGWRAAALYRPAGMGNEVGGDFYDLWALGEEWLLMIGDATGKGVVAAAMTSLVRHTARAAAEFDPRPARVLAQVDAALKRGGRASAICTALCARVAGRSVSLACGGHPLPFIVGPDGARDVGRPGTMLGAFDDAAWPEVCFEIQPGESIVAITDGVTDVVGEDRERFGRERLRTLLAGLSDSDPAEVRERLADALDRFQVGPQADDTAIVVMRLDEQPGAGSRRARASHRGDPIEIDAYEIDPV